jgi:hypothetical protein
MISSKDNTIVPPLNITRVDINQLLFSDINYSSKKLEEDNTETIEDNTGTIENDNKGNTTESAFFITRDVNVYNMNNDKKDLFSKIITDCKELIRYEENKYDSLLLQQKPEASSVENNIDELIIKTEGEIANLDKDIRAVRKDYTMIVNNMIQQKYKLDTDAVELQFIEKINSVLKQFSEGYYADFEL